LSVESGAGIGARLRSGRERAGLSLIEVAERLRVDPNAIEALEAEQFEELGASVYVRGHLRHYAELVGESPTELQELYAASGHAVRPPDLTRLPTTRSAGTSPTALIPGMAVVVAVALIGSAWWVAGNLGSSSGTQAPGAHRGSNTVAGRAAPARISTPGTALPVRAHTPLLGAPSAAGSPVAVSAVGHLATPSVLAGSGGMQQAQALPKAADLGASLARRSAAAHPRVSELQLHFSEDSWAEVYDARGQKLLFDVGSADSTRTVSGAPPLRVVLGNPVGVALELDGRPVSLPDGAARNVSIEFRINRSGRSAPSRLAAAEARNEERKPGRD
jgi:cytoskeleton protein RodZ